MVAVTAQYIVGKYRANERSVTVRSSNSQNGNPMILCFHGRGGDASQFAPYYWNGTWPFMEALAELGYIVISIDAGSSLTNWGNSDAMTAVNAAVDWAKNGALTGIDAPRADVPIGLMGWSMGGLVALNAHARLQATYGASALAGTFVFAPVCNLTTLYNNASYTAEINAAYGGNYPANGTAYNPSANTATYQTKPPIAMLHSSDDPTVPIADSQSFASAVGPASLLTRTGRGHFPFDGEPVATVTDFFQGVMPI